MGFLSRVTPTTDLERREALGALATILAVAGLALAWFFLYVQPREEFLGQVMDCMGGDASEASYQRCVEEISTAAVQSSTPPPSM